MQKGQTLIFLLIGILVLAVVGGAFYLGRSTSTKQSPTPVATSATPDETVNWKIYTNSEYGYSLKYPLKITLQSEAQTTTDITPSLEIVKDIGTPDYKIARIRIIDPEIERDPKKFPKENYTPIPKMSNLSLKDFTEKLWTMNKEDILHFPDKQVDDIFETDVNGHKAYQFALTISLSDPMGGGEVLRGKHLSVFTEQKGKIYNLIVPADDQLLNKVISTLKFTDQNQTNLSSICTRETNEIKKMITTFETLQTKRDNRGVLGLFTPPQTDQDKKTYGFLSGADTNSSPRLYNSGETNFNLQSYTISDNGPQEDINTVCTIGVTEKRMNYREGIGGFYSSQDFPVVLVLTKVNNEWRIDQYTSPNGGLSGKYSGW